MNDEVAKFLEDVDGVVEANSFERMMLWSENDRRPVDQRMTWKDQSFGLGETVGFIGKRPVFISLLKSTIDGKSILFIEATSQVVDNKMINEWLEKNLPLTAFREDNYVNKVDANNFHNVFRKPVDERLSDWLRMMSEDGNIHPADQKRLLKASEMLKPVETK